MAVNPMKSFVHKARDALHEIQGLYELSIHAHPRVSIDVARGNRVVDMAIQPC